MFKLLIRYSSRDERSIPPERLTLDHVDVASGDRVPRLAAHRAAQQPSDRQRSGSPRSARSTAWVQTQDPARMACCRGYLRSPQASTDQPAIARPDRRADLQRLGSADRSTRQGRRDADLAGHPLRSPPASRLADLTSVHRRGPADRRADRQRPQNQACPDRHEH